MTTALIIPLRPIDRNLAGQPTAQAVPPSGSPAKGLALSAPANDPYVRESQFSHDHAQNPT